MHCIKRVDTILTYLIPGIIGLGIITSYEDYTTGKIRNKWIVLALIYALIVNLGFILITLASPDKVINNHYLIELLSDAIFAIAIGYGLWHFKIWSAGDGKLFIAYALLIPASVYTVDYVEWMPSTTLIVNIFVVSFIIMSFQLFARIRFTDLKEEVFKITKHRMHPLRLAESVISLFAIFWLIQLLFSYIGLEGYFLLRIFATMYIHSLIQKTTGKYTTALMLAISVLRFFVDKQVYTLAFWINFAILVLIWQLIRSVMRGAISNLSQRVFSEDIPVEKLTRGMVLADTIQLVERKMTQDEVDSLKKHPEITIISQFEDFHFIKRPRYMGNHDTYIQEEGKDGGLNDRQIDKVRKVGFTTVRICQKIPFAPFMFIAVIGTLIAKGNVLIYIISSIFSGG